MTLPIKKVTVSSIMQKSIFIAEDKEMQLALMRKGVQDIDSDIIIYSAPNGDLAWEKFLANPTAVLITDINMPDGTIDGMDLASKVHRVSPATTILVVSGQLTDNNRRALITIKAGWVAKPADMNDIKLRVENGLDSFGRTSKVNELQDRREFYHEENRFLFELIHHTNGNEILDLLLTAAEMDNDDIEFKATSLCGKEGGERKVLGRMLNKLKYAHS